jgi:hypothetical protein
MPQMRPGPSEGREIRILSIDGGGIRGILPARLLQEIEHRLNKPIADLFHLIAGTSTGGIIGCGLAVGMGAKELGDIYNQHGGAIFARSMWQRVSNPADLAGPKYAPTTLEGILSEVLRDKTLRDVTSVELLVPTYAIELSKPQDADGVVSTRTPMFFKTWKARGEQLARGENRFDFNFALKDVARATSAAPTYFPPAQIANESGDRFGVVDGGVFANNPALCALSAGYALYPGAKFTLVSLGTGSLERHIPYADAKGWGDLQWLHPILSILMDGNADTICYQCDQVLGDRHFRFETTLGTDPASPISVKEDFDDASPDNVARLERLAESLISANDKRIGQLCELLARTEGLEPIVV